MGERADKPCICKDCQRQFTFSVAEQESCAARGHYHPPSRCPECRQARTRRTPERADGRSLHPVTCAKCGERTRVPFIPRTDKPVYCRACFLEMRGK